MEYIKSKKYETPELMSKIMGPNPIKLEEELLDGCALPEGSVVCDLGSGQGLTSAFLVKEYGFTVYAADLWSDEENPANTMDIGYIVKKSSVMSELGETYINEMKKYLEGCRSDL